MSIPRKALEGVQTIVSHVGCPDGTVSALLLSDALPKAEVKMVGHAELEALPASPGMLFCDIAPTADRAQEFVDAGAIVLDHHAGTEKIVRAFGELGRYADAETEPGVSGAVLAFEEVWKPMRDGRLGELPILAGGVAGVKRLATLTGIRDTWIDTAPEWRAACIQHQTLTFGPQERWLKLGLGDALVEIARLDWLGQIRVEQGEESVAKVINGGSQKSVTSRGAILRVFPGAYVASGVAGAADDTDLCIGFTFGFDQHGGFMNCALRSEGKYDCLALATMFGGGGHKNAAGFRFRVKGRDMHPFGLIPSLVDGFEKRGAQ